MYHSISSLSTQSSPQQTSSTESDAQLVIALLAAPTPTLVTEASPIYCAICPTEAATLSEHTYVCASIVENDQTQQKESPALIAYAMATHQTYQEASPFVDNKYLGLTGKAYAMGILNRGQNPFVIAPHRMFAQCYFQSLDYYILPMQQIPAGNNPLTPHAWARISQKQVVPAMYAPYLPALDEKMTNGAHLTALCHLLINIDGGNLSQGAQSMLFGIASIITMKKYCFMAQDANGDRRMHIVGTKENKNQTISYYTMSFYGPALNMLFTTLSISQVNTVFPTTHTSTTAIEPTDVTTVSQIDSTKELQYNGIRQCVDYKKCGIIIPHPSVKQSTLKLQSKKQLF